jgi:hypothetical protein
MNNDAKGKTGPKYAHARAAVAAGTAAWQNGSRTQAASVS